MKRNPNEENSNKKTNQFAKDIQNEKEEKSNTCNKIHEDNEINDENKTNKNNNEDIINILSNNVSFLETELDSYRNEFQLFKTFAQGLGFNTHEIQNEVHELRNGVHELRNNVNEIRYDVHGLSNKVHEIKNELHDIRNSLNFINNSLGNIFNLLIFEENLTNTEEQNNKINYDELLEEKELDEKSFEKYKEEKCVICLEDFNIGNKICNLPCLHIYHSFCIKNWLKIRGKCPLCGKYLLIQKNS